MRKTETQRIGWIDAVKLLASMGVFWGHYIRMFETLDISGPFMIFGILFRGMTDAGYWVCVFCILAGYFASDKSIQTRNNLVSAIFFRWIRFAVPMCICYMGVLLLAETIGFWSPMIGIEFGNEWLGNSYKESYGMLQAAGFSAVLSDRMNSSLWTIRPVFFGTSLIYICNYFLRKVSDKAKIICYLTLFCICIVMQCLFGMAFLYMGGVLAGAVLPLFAEKAAAKIDEKAALTGIVLIYILWSGGHEFLFQKITQTIPLPAVLGYNGYERMFYAYIFLIMIFCLPGLQNILENLNVKRFYSMSFSIYMVHFPLICSFSLWLYKSLLSKIDAADMQLIINFILTNIAVLLSAIIFGKAEKAAGRLISRRKAE